MAEAADIERVKRLAHPTIIANYSDTDIGAMIDADGVRGTLAELWEERATDTADFTTIKEGSSSREMAKAHDHAKERAAYWRAGTDASVGASRVHEITR